MNWKKAITDFKKEFKKTNEDIASEIGVSFMSIRNWTGGDVRPNRIAQIALKKMFKKYGHAPEVSNGE
jgi:DNA-binding XRE family transcriptional regulator